MHACEEKCEPTASSMKEMLRLLPEAQKRIGEITDSPLVHYLGGDLKSLLLLRGLPPASEMALSNCIFCECTFAKRRDLSLDWPMLSAVPDGPRPDLFPFVPIENTVPDPLHCLLRIFDALWARPWEDIQKEHPRNTSKATHSSFFFFFFFFF